MAALSLSRFGDGRTRAELISMLRPHAFRSPVGGTLLSILPVGSRINRESLVARLREASGGVRELRAPLAGKIEKVSLAAGSNLSAGDELLVLAPDPENVLQSLRALALVGRPEDLVEIELYTRGGDGMPVGVQKQAALTAEAIKGRG
jgi:multidrug efflux pump subunit AcrA (membrane-fusion protein)